MTEITITKMDAARRHLKLAVELWFQDGDPVPLHTLARAAYQVIHDLNVKAKGPELLLDTSIVKPEFRGKLRKLLTEPSDFMKHGDRGKAGSMKEVVLTTELTDGFILFAIQGLLNLKYDLRAEEVAFRCWHILHKPHVLTDAGQQLFENAFNVQILEVMRKMTKQEFFKRGVDIFRAQLPSGHATPPTRID